MSNNGYKKVPSYWWDFEYDIDSGEHIGFTIETDDDRLETAHVVTMEEAVILTEDLESGRRQLNRKKVHNGKR